MTVNNNSILDKYDNSPSSHKNIILLLMSPKHKSSK